MLMNKHKMIHNNNSPNSQCQMLNNNSKSRSHNNKSHNNRNNSNNHQINRQQLTITKI